MDPYRPYVALAAHLELSGCCASATDYTDGANDVSLGDVTHSSNRSPPKKNIFFYFPQTLSGYSFTVRVPTDHKKNLKNLQEGRTAKNLILMLMFFYYLKTSSRTFQKLIFKEFAWQFEKNREERQILCDNLGG